MAQLQDVFAEALRDHEAAVAALHGQYPSVEQIAHAMTRAIQSGHKVLWCGNGGSAADSQHLAAEFVGHFHRERRGLPSIALTTDTSILTSVANDYGYEEVFRRQVEAHCVEGDVLVGITTSGNSRNVCSALRSGREHGAFTVAFTGASGGEAAEIAHATLRVPSSVTARVQECHILCGHILCEWVDRTIYNGGAESLAQ